MHHPSTTRTTDTLLEVGRFLLEARAASRRAAVAARTASPVAVDVPAPVLPRPARPADVAR